MRQRSSLKRVRTPVPLPIVQDHPQARTLASGTLTLGDLTFDCAVVQLPDGSLERVLSTRKFTAALGRGQRRSGTKLPPFLAPENLKPFVDNEMEVVPNPIMYATRGGRHKGYPASFLVDVCNVYLHARRDGALREQQEHIAARCEEILGALAKVGIVALVDEATGYQRERDDDALQQFLNRYLAHHPLPWRETFAQDYYVQLHRLAGKAYDPATRQRGVWVGSFTKKYVYDYLLPAEGYQQLCAKNPRTSETHYGRTHNHHQFFTAEMGKPHLLAHLNLVLGLMRSSPNLAAFRRLFARAMPARIGKQMHLPLGE